MLITVIPAYNEEVAIGTIVLLARRHSDQVIVVSDGSTDRTAEVAGAAGAAVVSHPENRGKGAALKTGFRAALKAGADIIVCLDGDGQHDPMEIPAVAEPVELGKADIAVGSRFISKGGRKSVPKYRRVGLSVLNAATRKAGGAAVMDSQSGFRAFSARALRKIRFSNTGMAVESEMLVRAGEEGLSVVEVPITVRYEGLNGSTLPPVQHGVSVLAPLLSIVREKHPLLFFSVPGLCLVVAGFSVGVYILNTYLTYRFLPFGPSLLAMGLIFVGILAIFAGLILNTMNHLLARWGHNRGGR